MSIYTLFVDYIVQDGSNVATFGSFKDWINNNTVFVFRDEDGDIVREVNVKTVFENSDPAKLEWSGNTPIIFGINISKTFPWFSGHNWHKTPYHLDW